MDIAFANELLNNLPSDVYNPVVFVDKTNRVIDEILDKFIVRIKGKMLVVAELKDLDDVRNVESLFGNYLNKSSVLIIRNIHQYETDAEFADKFVWICEMAKNNQIQLILTTNRKLQDLKFEGRLYARLQSGIVADIDNVMK